MYAVHLELCQDKEQATSSLSLKEKSNTARHGSLHDESNYSSKKIFKIIQEEDTYPFIYTSLNHEEDDQETYEPQSDINPIRKSNRTCRAPDRMCLHVDAEEHKWGDLGEPANFKAALLDPESEKWLNAMNVEMQSMRDNEVWDLVDLPPNGKTVGHKWLFKKKTDMDGALHTYKARLVYMEQPEGFVNLKFPNRVCKLKRSIYGLKQASMQWNKRLDDEIKKFSFSQNRDEPCAYMKASGSYVTFLILYGDDILIIGNNIPMLQDVKSYLGRCFVMKDLGEAAYILGIKIYRDRSKRLIGLCQSAYIEKIMKRFYMEKSKRGPIPICTRLNVAFAQNITSRFQQNLGEVHWTVVKNILKYLRNTKDTFLVYGGDTKRVLRVSCYTNAGYLTDADDMKSQTRYVFVLNGCVVDWKSTNQKAVWIRKFISGLGVVPTIEEPINMYCDNTGAIAIAKDHGVTKGARHFRAKVHYLRETIEMGDVKIEKVDTDDNLADPFTKALAFPKHSELTKKIGMIPASSLM
ncbi:retrotransposon protein, putative, ty1-copia subclass [Tanacetum coccineum]